MQFVERSHLWNALHNEFDIRNFDPALPGLDAAPEPADLVACIDVLEHVEPQYLRSVLADLARLTLKAGLLTIATRESGKQLADGTNCHRILQRPDWWMKRLGVHFPVVRLHMPNANNGLEVIVEQSHP